MTAEEQPAQFRLKPLILRPWIVIVGALVFFGVTLNHWVTLSSLPIVSQICGWDWHPGPLPWRTGPIKPLFLVLTWPVRLLPAAWQPLSLNGLSALWAALTLGLLAVSVRLLPQDRTRDQREREPGEFALLSVRAAFLPALFAVLMLAGQINFWQNAVAASADMLDLLVFAFLIFCLLRYRIGQNDRWLTVLAFVYGLGVVDNGALLGFFPLFLIALIWIKGAAFFNLRFVAKMLVFGVAGLLLYLLVPLLGSLGNDHYRFGTLLHIELGAQRFGLRLVPRWVVMLAALSTVLPLLFAGVRWPSYDGEISQTGDLLLRWLLRLLHVVFLVLALLLFFDFRYSPSFLMRQTPVAWLTFYYLGALAIGYFSGYLLLLSARQPAQGTDQAVAAASPLASAMQGALWLAAVALPLWLLARDFPRIEAGNSGVLAQFSDEIVGALPPQGAIVLSDDSARLLLAEAACQRHHLASQNVFIETTSMPRREYLRYLVSRYPELQKSLPPLERLQPVAPTETLVNFILQASQRRPVYYLHPSFGYLFEVFYLQPHGVVYELRGFTNNAAQAPLPSAADVAENQAFWARLEKGPLRSLPELARKDGTVQAVAGDYSIALDFWGVELQRSNRLKEANASFAAAVRLKPDNLVAGLNLEYNNHLQKGDRRPMNSAELLRRALRFYRDLTHMLVFNGPADEPNLNLQFGEIMAANRYYRQATGVFERCQELVPDNVGAELDMAKVYIDRGMGTKALEILRGLPESVRSLIDPWNFANLEAMAHAVNREYAIGEKTLRDALRATPKDPNRIGVLAEFYRLAGDAALRENKEAEARQYFAGALTNLTLQIEILSAEKESKSPPRALLEALLKKGEIQIQLKSFDGALATVNQFLQLEPANPSALFLRAVAEVQSKQTQAAKNDYNTLRTLLPSQSYLVDYGLADVAAVEKDKAEEVRCLRRYLESAPKEAIGYDQARQRLQKLESH